MPRVRKNKKTKSNKKPPVIDQSYREPYKHEVLGLAVQIKFIYDEYGHAMFFEGVIARVRMELDSKQRLQAEHFIQFHDGDQRWFDLAGEEDLGRLKWPEDSEVRIRTMRAAAMNDTSTAAAAASHHYSPGKNGSRPPQSVAAASAAAAAVAAEAKMAAAAAAASATVEDEQQPVQQPRRRGRGKRLLKAPPVEPPSSSDDDEEGENNNNEEEEEEAVVYTPHTHHYNSKNATIHSMGKYIPPGLITAADDDDDDDDDDDEDDNEPLSASATTTAHHQQHAAAAAAAAADEIMMNHTTAAVTAEPLPPHDTNEVHHADDVSHEDLERTLLAAPLATDTLTPNTDRSLLAAALPSDDHLNPSMDDDHDDAVVAPVAAAAAAPDTSAASQKPGPLALSSGAPSTTSMDMEDDVIVEQQPTPAAAQEGEPPVSKEENEPVEEKPVAKRDDDTMKKQDSETTSTVRDDKASLKKDEESEVPKPKKQLQKQGSGSAADGDDKQAAKRAGGNKVEEEEDGEVVVGGDAVMDVDNKKKGAVTGSDTGHDKGVEEKVPSSEKPSKKHSVAAVEDSLSADMDQRRKAQSTAAVNGSASVRTTDKKLDVGEGEVQSEKQQTQKSKKQSAAAVNGGSRADDKLEVEEGEVQSEKQQTQKSKKQGAAAANDGLSARAEKKRERGKEEGEVQPDKPKKHKSKQPSSAGVDHRKAKATDSARLDESRAEVTSTDRERGVDEGGKILAGKHRKHNSEKQSTAAVVEGTAERTDKHRGEEGKGEVRRKKLPTHKRRKEDDSAVGDRTFDWEESEPELDVEDEGQSKSEKRKKQKLKKFVAPTGKSKFVPEGSGVEEGGQRIRKMKSKTNKRERGGLVGHRSFQEGTMEQDEEGDVQQSIPRKKKRPKHGERGEGAAGKNKALKEADESAGQQRIPPKDPREKHRKHGERGEPGVDDRSAARKATDKGAKARDGKRNGPKQGGRSETVVDRSQADPERTDKKGSKQQKERLGNIQKQAEQEAAAVAEHHAGGRVNETEEGEVQKQPPMDQKQSGAGEGARKGSNAVQGRSQRERGELKHHKSKHERQRERGQAAVDSSKSVHELSNIEEGEVEQSVPKNHEQRRPEAVVDRVTARKRADTEEGEVQQSDGEVQPQKPKHRKSGAREPAVDDGKLAKKQADGEEGEIQQEKPKHRKRTVRGEAAVAIQERKDKKGHEKGEAEHQKPVKPQKQSDTGEGEAQQLSLKDRKQGERGDVASALIEMARERPGGKQQKGGQVRADGDGSAAARDRKVEQVPKHKSQRARDAAALDDSNKPAHANRGTDERDAKDQHQPPKQKRAERKADVVEESKAAPDWNTINASEAENRQQVIRRKAAPGINGRDARDERGPEVDEQPERKRTAEDSQASRRATNSVVTTRNETTPVRAYAAMPAVATASVARGTDDSRAARKVTVTGRNDRTEATEAGKREEMGARNSHDETRQKVRTKVAATPYNAKQPVQGTIRVQAPHNNDNRGNGLANNDDAAPSANEDVGDKTGDPFGAFAMPSEMPRCIPDIIKLMDKVEPGKNYYERQKDRMGACSQTRDKLIIYVREHPGHPASKFLASRRKFRPPSDREGLVALMELIRTVIDSGGTTRTGG